jgi:hypothetical protein
MAGALNPAAAPRGSHGWGITLALFAAGNLLNALWMLASPWHWYYNLPANVPASGPLNEHFVRDIGSIYLLIGVALAAAVVRRSLRVPAMILASAFYTLHALVHMYDSMRGLFAPGHWWRYDLVPIYGATLLLLWLTARLARAEGSA